MTLTKSSLRNLDGARGQAVPVVLNGFPDMVNVNSVIQGCRRIWRMPGAFMAAIAFVLVIGPHPAMGDPRGTTVHSFEPTVTLDEHRLLNTAMEIAATNPPLAIRTLLDADLAKSGPALDFTLGNLYVAAEDLSAAEQAYLNAIRKMPAFRAAVVNLGRVYLRQDRAADASGLFQGLVRDGRADADVFLLLGNALLMQHRTVSAEIAYRQALLLRPNHLDTRLSLLRALIQQERYPECLALIGEILRHEPDRPEIWALRAQCLLALERFEAAISVIEQARRLGCADAGMLALLGDLYLRRDQPEDALHAYELAFRHATPSFERVLRALEGFLAIDDRHGAGRMIERAETMRQTSEETLVMSHELRLLRLRAELESRLGRIEQAVALCEEALGIDPMDGATLVLLAGLRHRTDRLEEAVMLCERAARIQGFEADALVLQARIEVDREQYDQAVRLLEAAQAFRDRPQVARYIEQLRRLTESR